MMQRPAPHISRLTQQLLAFEKAVHREGSPRMAPVDLGEVTASVLEAHAPAALRRGINVVFERATDGAVAAREEIQSRPAAVA